MFYPLATVPQTMNFPMNNNNNSNSLAPSPLQWLQALNPYQQALIMPLLQSVGSLNSPAQILFDEQTAKLQQSLNSIFLAQQQCQPKVHGDAFLHSESVQENSPFLTFQNVNIRPKSDSLSQSDLFFSNNNNTMKLKTGNANVSIHHPLNLSEQSKKSKKIISKQQQSSLAKSACANGLGLDDKDDKNIIHINFTKNLLKSFRRYCEYYHKSNIAMLEAIKSDFETSHMNNQLLVHFMTSTLTMDAFKQFVNGPAQKWVKEQSRLKKQDQQLELIEICRQRLFDKIKVKKYSDSVNPSQIEDANTTTSSAQVQLTAEQERILHKPQSIFKSDLNDTDKDSSCSDSMSNSESSDEKTVKVVECSPSKKICTPKDKMVVLHEEVDAKIEEIEQSIKVEEGNLAN